MEFHLFVAVFKRLQLHGQSGLDAGQRHDARFPQYAQRAEVVKLSSLFIKSSQVQNGITVIWNRYLEKCWMNYEQTIKISQPKILPFMFTGAWNVFILFEIFSQEVSNQCKTKTRFKKELYAAKHIRWGLLTTYTPLVCSAAAAGRSGPAVGCCTQGAGWGETGGRTQTSPLPAPQRDKDWSHWPCSPPLPPAPEEWHNNWSRWPHATVRCCFYSYWEPLQSYRKDIR